MTGGVGGGNTGGGGVVGVGVVTAGTPVLWYPKNARCSSFNAWKNNSSRSLRPLPSSASLFHHKSRNT